MFDSVHYRYYHLTVVKEGSSNKSHVTPPPPPALLPWPPATFGCLSRYTSLVLHKAKKVGEKEAVASIEPR